MTNYDPKSHKKAAKKRPHRVRTSPDPETNPYYTNAWANYYFGEFRGLPASKPGRGKGAEKPSGPKMPRRKLAKAPKAVKIMKKAKPTTPPKKVTHVRRKKMVAAVARPKRK